MLDNDYYYVCASLTILATQKNRISLPVSKRWPGKNSDKRVRKRERRDREGEREKQAWKKG